MDMGDVYKKWDKDKEKTIEILAPQKDFTWERNDALIKQLSYALEITSNSSEGNFVINEQLHRNISIVERNRRVIAILPNSRNSS
jgi:hypothetical protein